MKLIVGLGNPGAEYIKTRHNLGYMVVDELCIRWGIGLSENTKLKSQMFTGLIDDQTIVLAKRQTFMNLSGQAVHKVKNFYKLENQDIWVVSDDLDLEFGKIRTRVGGSSGGHNGLKDIIEQIGDDFVRIRIGIKNQALTSIPADKFVLQRFDKNEENKLPDIIIHTIQVILGSLENGVEHTSVSS